MKWLFILLLLIPAMAFAESQTASTDGGILDVRITYDDDIMPNADNTVIIEFINSSTDKIQLHIDYDINMTVNDTVIATTPMIHSSEGVVRGLKVPFPVEGEYILRVGVEGILFQPINRETVSFTIPVGIVAVQTPEPGGGCLIATAAYGTELAPQIQNLRQIRDEMVLSTDSGKWFISAFNQAYYVFSPTVADMQRENPVLKNVVLLSMQPMLVSLGLMEYADSESKVLVYGILIILLNMATYMVGPVLILVWLLLWTKKRLAIAR